MSKIYSFSASTNIGCRESNQDNFVAGSVIAFPAIDTSFSIQDTDTSTTPRVFAVCDGVGSRPSSAQTARVTLESLVSCVECNTDLDFSDEWIRETVRTLQKNIADFLQKTEADGSNTLSFLILDRERFVFANIGDSPAFILKKGVDYLTEITVRHNLETYNRLTGKPVGPNDSSYLLYSFGSNPFDLSTVVNIFDGALDSGDSFIICTDGITNAIGDDEIVEMLNSGAKAEDFVNLAIQAPEADNCTAIVIHID